MGKQREQGISWTDPDWFRSVAENIALLALVVMGWPEHEWSPDGFCLRCGLAAIPLNHPCQHMDWDPYSSDADATEMLDTFSFSKVVYWKGRKMAICTLRRCYFGENIRQEGTLRREAICAACLEWARAQGEQI